MNVSELNQLTHWIDNEIVAKEVLRLYEALRDILQANSRQSQKQPFEEQKNQLIGVILQIPVESLSTEQLALLNEFGIGHHVGQEAVAELEDILFRNAIDLATAVERLNVIVEELRTGIERSQTLQKSLDGIAPSESAIEGKVLIRVTFSGDAKITNIVDLREWSDTWYDIGRGVAILNDSTPEEVQVVGAGEGSVVIELAVGYAVAKTISSILLEALKVVEKVVDIQKKALEIKALKLSNSKIAKELEDEARQQRDTGIEQIADKLTARKKGADQGDKIEAFRRAVTKLVGFVERGGDVDCVLPLEEVTQENTEEKPERREIKQLRTTFKQIRQLEFQLKQIEDRKDTPPTNQPE
ncbi:MAG: hypothetical protein M3Z22_04370 [Verrucomicrobiota bacterium]|nr:hypothetical protein [Verrucomicrobiota bacterium]